MSSKDYIYCYQGKSLRFGSGNVVVGEKYDPYNPLKLKPFTIRAKFKPGVTPTMGDSQTIVDADENVWDITKNNTSWSWLLKGNSVISVLGANSTGVTNMNTLVGDNRDLISVALFDTRSCTSMNAMFNGCRSLTSVPLFDLSSCEIMSWMFQGCTNITSLPNFDLRSAKTMNWAFENCYAVESGALELYRKASTNGVIQSHQDTFKNCGINTVTGAAELAQIPPSWGGTMSDSQVDIPIEEE